MASRSIARTASAPSAAAKLQRLNDAGSRERGPAFRFPGRRPGVGTVIRVLGLVIVAIVMAGWVVTALNA
jgi:hypothetical protein